MRRFFDEEGNLLDQILSSIRWSWLSSRQYAVRDRRCAWSSDESLVGNGSVRSAEPLGVVRISLLTSTRVQPLGVLRFSTEEKIVFNSELELSSNLFRFLFEITMLLRE